MLAAGGFATYLILREFQPDEVGAYVDPMHMTIEGGVSGWEMGLDLLPPGSAPVGIKNFRWLPDARDELGQMRYRWEYSPLADGMAPLPEFMGFLRLPSTTASSPCTASTRATPATARCPRRSCSSSRPRT